jgi:hypothetical protein
VEENITVTVSDEHLGDVDEVADQLRAAGMNVAQVLGGVGIITGSVDSDRRADLEHLPGVTAVEAEHTFVIPPPDSEVQ